MAHERLMAPAHGGRTVFNHSTGTRQTVSRAKATKGSGLRQQIGLFDGDET